VRAAPLSPVAGQSDFAPLGRLTTLLPITSNRISTQPTTLHRRRGRAGRKRHDVESELNPPKSACAGDAVLRPSTWGTVPMGQCAGCHRGQHLTFLQMTYTARVVRCLCIEKRRERVVKVSVLIYIGVCWPKILHGTDFVGRKCRSTSFARRGLTLCVLKVARSYTSFTRRSSGTCPCAPLSLPALHPLSSLADSPSARLLLDFLREIEFVCSLLQRSRRGPLRNQARGSRH
jgi:hypothetical protein